VNFSRTPSPLAVALNLIGAVVVAWSLAVTHSGQRPVWVTVVGVVAVGAWAGRAAFAAIRLQRLALALAVLAALAGAVTAAPTDSLMIVPAAAGIMSLISDELRPLWQGLALAVAVLVIIPLGALPFGTGVIPVLAMMGGILLAVFAGLSRRQFRLSEAQAAELRERDLTMREEASRIAIARDLHDVLAHSLGGLVIQLDAVDALLEAGDASAARARVVDARDLAAEGLSEARRAVAALRDPASREQGARSAPDLEASLHDLVAAHRSLGGDADLAVSGEGRELAADQAAAVQRALQEALSNARKHAPGALVAARLDWQTDRVRLTVSNPLVVPDPRGASDRHSASDRHGASDRHTVHPVLARSGGGHGLEGMRERFAALPLGGTATAENDEGRFTVTAETMLP